MFKRACDIHTLADVVYKSYLVGGMVNFTVFKETAEWAVVSVALRNDANFETYWGVLAQPYYILCAVSPAPVTYLACAD